MIEQVSYEMNQVPKRRPRLAVYVRIDKCPTPEDFANLGNDAVAVLERRRARPIFASKDALVTAHHFLTWTAEKDMHWQKERETSWEPGQELPWEPDPEMHEFLSKSFNEQTQQVVLKFCDVLRQAWSGDSSALQIIQVLAQLGAKIVLAKSGQIELVVDDLLGAACIMFLRDFGAGRLGMCANPQCPSPFFVRSRKNQKFCDVPACMVYSHRNSAYNYWTRRRAREQGNSKKKVKKR